MTHRLSASTLICALALSACKRDEAGQGSPESTEGGRAIAPSSAQAVARPPGAPAHGTPAATEPVRDAPIYDLEVSLTDQTNEAVTLDVFRGSPVIVSMFYATCPYACPTLISDIKRIEQRLDKKARAATRVLLVTFDPERDTPQKLTEIAREHGVDTQRWKFARASEENTRDLANVLGLKYRKLKSGQFNHSSVITVIDEKGIIRDRVEGLQQSNDTLVETLQQLASTESTAPSLPSGPPENERSR